MVDDARLRRVRRWRLKAEKCRAVAGQTSNPVAQASFRQMAEAYDTLAERFEERLARAAVKQKPS
jgi:hypothetical protein